MSPVVWSLFKLNVTASYRYLKLLLPLVTAPSDTHSVDIGIGTFKNLVNYSNSMCDVVLL